MTGFFWNILLALAWVALSGNFSGINLLFGFVVGYGLLSLLQPQLAPLKGYRQRLPRLLSFMGYFLAALLRANLKVAYDILTPSLRMRPGVIRFPLNARTDFEITMVANFISLTPGSLVLDVSDDRRVLYIHAMFLQDEAALLHNLHELERRILAIMR